MKKPLLAALGSLLACLPLLAQGATDPQKSRPRANRMVECNKEAHAKGLHKDERRKFMSACLSSAHAAKAAPASASAATPAPAPSAQ